MSEIKKYTYNFNDNPVYWTPVFIFTRGYIKSTTPEEAKEWTEKQKKKNSKKPVYPWAYYIEGILPKTQEFKDSIEAFKDMDKALKEFEAEKRGLDLSNFDDAAQLKTKQILREVKGTWDKRTSRNYKCYDGKYYVNFTQKNPLIVPVLTNDAGDKIDIETLKPGDLIRVMVSAYYTSNYDMASCSFTKVKRFKHLIDLPELNVKQVEGEYADELSESDKKLVDSITDLDLPIE